MHSNWFFGPPLQFLTQLPNFMTAIFQSRIAKTLQCMVYNRSERGQLGNNSKGWTVENWAGILLVSHWGGRFKISEIMKTRCNDIQWQKANKKIRDKRSIVLYWNRKQEYGREPKIVCCNTNKRNRQAYFQLAICKLTGIKERCWKRKMPLR